MEVFTLSRGWKITMYILLSILMLVFVALAFGPLYDPSMKKGIAIILPISLIVIGLLVCAFLQVEEKVIFNNYSVRKESKLVNRELLPSDIKGYRVDKNYLTIIPYKGRGKVIRVSTYMSGVRVLESKLAARYPDLNVQEAREEFNEVVKQTGEKDISRSIKKAKIEVYTLTGITVGLCALSYFYAGIYQILLFCCVPLSLLLLLRHRGLVQLNSSTDSPLPSISLILLLVVVMQLIQNSRIHMLNYSRLWQLSLGVTGMLIALLWLCSKHLNKKKETYILTAVLLSIAFVGHGYGLVVSANCMMDKKSSYEYYESVVTNKRTSRGTKNRSYYLTVQPWSHQPVVKEESVSRDMYDEVQINDKVGIYYFNGTLQIPWYIIDRAE